MLKRLLVPVVLGLAAAGCIPTGEAPPTNPTCDAQARFWTADDLTVTGTTNLPSGTPLAVRLYGNGAYYDTVTFTVPTSKSIFLNEAVPDWGYPVWWDGDVIYQGRVLCSAGVLQGARYITDPDWWEGCDTSCLYT